ncbi:MAG: TonB-dependent receptor [Bacteroidales bacterium]|nr:TonB-dependent receptor [Bacteroidales bacterium]
MSFAIAQKIPEVNIDIPKGEYSAKQLIEILEQQSKLKFSYNSELLPSASTYSYTAHQKPLKQVLKNLSEMLDLDFVWVEGQLVIKPKPPKTERKPKVKTHTISGTIKDAETGETMIGATILVSGTSIGTISNNYGFFSLSLPEGTYIIRVSYMGYLAKEQTFVLDKNQIFNTDLSFDYQPMSEVDVEVSVKDEVLKKSAIGNITIKQDELKRKPELAGENGLIRTLETLPGVHTLGDGASFYYTRGGFKDQNLILMDEAPIYSSSHLMGLYSVINPDATKTIDVYKSDMPVSYGDRLSSMTVIQTRDGNMNKAAFTGVINPFVFRVTAETPIVKERLSIFTSFRHSTINWLFRKNNPNLDIHFSDLNLKLKYKINERNRLFLSYYTGSDVLENIGSNNSGFGMGWSNFAASVRWNHIFNDKLFSNTTLYGGAYNYHLNINENEQLEWRSFIRNVTLKTEFSYFSSLKQTFKLGYELNFHAFDPGNIDWVEVNEVPQKQVNQIVFYFNDSYDISKRWRLNAGFRLPIWANTGPVTVYRFDENHEVTDTSIFSTNKIYNAFINFDPRLSLRYQINEQSFIGISYGIYHQYIHLLSNTSGPFTTLDVWVPSDINIKPSRADMINLTYRSWYLNDRLELLAEVYYKRMDEVIAYKPHANMLLNPLIEGELRFGSSTAYGFEWSLNKQKGFWSGRVSYAYARVFMQFDELNNGEIYRAYYDQPHQISFNLSYQLSERWQIMANWVYATGAAITSPIDFYTYNNQTLPLYGSINNDRLPDYHRLDLAINWQMNKHRDKRFQHLLNFSIFNLYNRKNAVGISHNKIKTGDNTFEIPSNLYEDTDLVTTQTYLLGFMPSLTYRFKF